MENKYKIRGLRNEPAKRLLLSCYLLATVSFLSQSDI